MLASRSSFLTLRMTRTSYRHPLQIPMSGLCITSVHRYVCSIVLHFHVWQSMNKLKFKIPCMCLSCAGILQYAIVDCMWQTNIEINNLWLSENYDIINDDVQKLLYCIMFQMLALKLYWSWVGLAMICSLYIYKVTKIGHS